MSWQCSVNLPAFLWRGFGFSLCPVLCTKELEYKWEVATHPVGLGLNREASLAFMLHIRTRSSLENGSRPF